MFLYNPLVDSLVADGVKRVFLFKPPEAVVVVGVVDKPRGRDNCNFLEGFEFVIEVENSLK